MTDPHDRPDPAGEDQRSASDQADRTERPPLPEPSLRTFVSGMAGQVLISLGLFENPATGKKEVNVEQAKYSIDLLQILYDKMQGNLTDEEEKLMSSILYDLRMRYVEIAR